MATDFLERLRSDRLIGYMPMQTFLVEEYGKPMENHLSEWILAHPGEYQDAARRSFDAGCDMVHTGTQASSRIRSKPFGLEDRVYEFNFESAKLARVEPRANLGDAARRAIRSLSSSWNGYDRLNNGSFPQWDGDHSYIEHW